MIKKYDTKLEALAKYIQTISFLRKDGITGLECLTLAMVILLPEKHKYNPLSTAARAQLQKLLKVSKASLHNRIYALLQNKYLYRDEDNIIQITPFFKRLKDSPLLLNVSYTYDEESTPSDPSYLNASFITRGPNIKSSVTPLQESQGAVI